MCTLWYGINPKTRIIRPSGKLNDPRYQKVRPRIEVILRVLIVAFGLLVLYEDTIPLTVDVVQAARGERPVKIIGTVTYKSVPFGGVWFLKQSVRVQGYRDAYFLLYSATPLLVGRSYELLILPRSRMILDFSESDQVQDETRPIRLRD